MTSGVLNQSCFIIPPYMLQALGRSEDQALAERAHREQHHDEALRERRAGLRPDTSGAVATLNAAGTGHPVRSIHDAKHTTRLPGTEVRAEGDAAGQDEAVNQAYDGLGDTWTFYDEVFGRDSIDGAGMHLVGTVHYGTDYDNAFWNGEQMVFGDGDQKIFTGFTGCVDVIGHELTHGITQYTAALEYQGQSGALNESLSDVFGVMVKQYALGQTADQADWLIGAGLLAPGVNGRALRDMLHPGTAYDDPQLGKDPQPADMAHYVTTSSDNGGVHTNSSIPNRAFALAATTIGGKAWEAAGRVWYDVVTGGKVTSTCDFATFAQLTIDAAAARFGADSSQAKAISDAWATVGVTGSAPATKKTPTKKTTTKKPSPATPVLVERSGGIAGAVKRAEVRLDQLPDDDAQAWQGLLAGTELESLAEQVGADGPVADGFTYRVCCEPLDVDERLAEHALPDHLRELFARTLSVRAAEVEGGTQD